MLLPPQRSWVRTARRQALQALLLLPLLLQLLPLNLLCCCRLMIVWLTQQTLVGRVQAGASA
jgi:hypothetical protein